MNLRGLLVGMGFLSFSLVNVWAYDWPAPDISLRKTFCQRTGDNFEPGLEFDTMADHLTAPEKGQVIFVSSPQASEAQDLPSSLGGFVVMAHADNLRTAICGIVPNSIETSQVVVKGDPLGATQPTSPGALTRHQLFVFDQQLKEIVNPLLVFPPLTDVRSPVILDVKVVPAEGGDSVSLFSHTHFAVGYWKLYVDAVDPWRTDNGTDVQAGLYSVSAYLNGTGVFKTELTSLVNRDGHWIIKGSSAPLSSVVVGDHEWYLGKVFFNQGTNFLELNLKDFQGKESGRTFRVMGNHP